MDLLRPTFPGMMRNVRKNLFNLVLLVDPIKPAARDLIKLAESFVVHTAPIRLGLVFDSRNTGTQEEDYRAILCAFNYYTQNRSTRDALGFLTDVSYIYEIEIEPIICERNHLIFTRSFLPSQVPMLTLK